LAGGVVSAIVVGQGTTVSATGVADGAVLVVVDELVVVDDVAGSLDVVATDDDGVPGDELHPANTSVANTAAAASAPGVASDALTRPRRGIPSPSMRAPPCPAQAPSRDAT
jgi:hypothetical protein